MQDSFIRWISLDVAKSTGVSGGIGGGRGNTEIIANMRIH